MLDVIIKFIENNSIIIATPLFVSKDLSMVYLIIGSILPSLECDYDLEKIKEISSKQIKLSNLDDTTKTELTDTVKTEIDELSEDYFTARNYYQFSTKSLITYAFIWLFLSLCSRICIQYSNYILTVTFLTLGIIILIYLKNKFFALIKNFNILGKLRYYPLAILPERIREKSTERRVKRSNN